MAKLKLQGHASGTGIFTLSPPNSSTDRTITLPDSSGALLTDGSTIGTSQIADDAVTEAKLANAINTAIAANTAKVTNATHTGDVTGATALTIAADAVTTAKIADDNVTADKLANSINTDIATGVTANTTANAALPKAGGAMTGNTTHGDNNKSLWGTGNDLEIYHDGSNSIIIDGGVGDLKLRSNGTNVDIGNANGEVGLRYVSDGAVELYHDNTKKLETTSTGVSVTGYLFGPTNIGLDTTDKIQFSDGSNINFVVNGGDEKRLEADGDLHVDGDVIAYSTTISDERLKDNIEIVDGALDKVKELKGVTFNRKQDGQKSAGVIAQDVEKVLPEAVKHKALPLHTGDDELFKTVQYDALHALLIEAVKELSEKVEKLENK